MLGENVVMSPVDFNPYLPNHKEGYYELEQLRPGVVMCPFCETIIDATQNEEVKAAFEVIQFYNGVSWGSVPICTCPKVWAIYDPNIKKWAFRYEIPTGDTEWH